MASPESSTEGRTATESASVYKYYDRHGILIYVGMTTRGLNRNRQHNADKGWWELACRQAIEHFDSREAARAREAELIRAYCPPFNRHHNPHQAEIYAAYVALGSADEFDEEATVRVIRAAAQAGVRRLELYPFSARSGVPFFVTRTQDNAFIRCLDDTRGVRILDQYGVEQGTLKTLERGTLVLKLEPRSFKCLRGTTVVSAEIDIAYASLKRPVRVRAKLVRVRIV